MSFSRTNIDDAHFLLILEELQSNVDVLNFLGSHLRSLIVVANFLASQHFNESNQTNAIGEVLRQVGNMLVDRLQVFIGPSSLG